MEWSKLHQNYKFCQNSDNCLRLRFLALILYIIVEAINFKLVLKIIKLQKLRTFKIIQNLKKKKKKTTSVSVFATNDRIDLLGAEGLNHRSY